MISISRKVESLYNSIKNNISTLSLDAHVNQLEKINEGKEKLSQLEKIQLDFMLNDLKASFRSFIESDGRYQVERLQRLSSHEDDWYLWKICAYDKKKDEYFVGLYNATLGVVECDYYIDIDEALEVFVVKK